MPGWDKSACNFYTSNTPDIEYGMVKYFSFILLFDFRYMIRIYKTCNDNQFDKNIDSIKIHFYIYIIFEPCI